MILVIFTGLVFNLLPESIIFFVVISVIRAYSGGYHSNSVIGCCLISLLSITGTLALIKFSLWNEMSAVIATGLSIAVFLIYAPMEHKNKQLSDKEIKVYRKVLLIIITGVTVFLLAALKLKFLSAAFACSSALTISAVMVLVGKAANGRKRT